MTGVIYENEIFSKCSQLSLYIIRLGDAILIDWISIDFHKSKCQISALWNNIGPTNAP